MSAPKRWGVDKERAGLSEERRYDRLRSNLENITFNQLSHHLPHPLPVSDYERTDVRIDVARERHTLGVVHHDLRRK